jgi:ABC-type multidrug transport system ATPase subunit
MVLMLRDSLQLNLVSIAGTTEVSSRAYCSWFGFKSGDQQKKVGILSGGERNRAQLAKVVKSGANVLLLDEPTNDLGKLFISPFVLRLKQTKRLRYLVGRNRCRHNSLAGGGSA